MYRKLAVFILLVIIGVYLLYNYGKENYITLDNQPIRYCDRSFCSGIPAILKMQKCKDYKRDIERNYYDFCNNIL